jgi:hypothetical protein
LDPGGPSTVVSATKHTMQLSKEDDVEKKMAVMRNHLYEM